MGLLADDEGSVPRALGEGTPRSNAESFHAVRGSLPGLILTVR